DVRRTVSGDNPAGKLGPRRSRRADETRNGDRVIRLVQKVVAVHDVGQVFIVVGSRHAEEIVAPIVGLGKGHKRPGHGHTGTRRVKKQTRDDELAGANFSSGCREARDAQPAGRASYRARIAELVLVVEAGLESVANRQQGRITCSKFTIFQGARRGPANTPQLNVVKMTIPHPIGLTRRKYAGPHGYPDQRLSEVKSTAVGQLTDVALLAVLVDAKRKRRVQAVKATL